MLHSIWTGRSEFSSARWEFWLECPMYKSDFQLSRWISEVDFLLWWCSPNSNFRRISTTKDTNKEKFKMAASCVNRSGRCSNILFISPSVLSEHLAGNWYDWFPNSLYCNPVISGVTSFLTRSPNFGANWNSALPVSRGRCGELDQFPQVMSLESAAKD